MRSCVFADLTAISYLLADPHAQAYVNLGIRDEDGLGLISIAILGFGSESERDVEREECVRLLIAQGADISGDSGSFVRLVFSHVHRSYTWSCSQPGGLLYTMQHCYLHPH